MKIEFFDNTAVIESEAGEITKIAPPEDISENITNLISTDFVFDVEGFVEHYIAYATNHTNLNVIDSAIEFFKINKASI